MDFFEHQEVARRKTGRLVLFFLLAVAGIIVLIHLVASAVFVSSGNAPPEAAFLDWRIFLLVAAGVILVVALGSLYKVSVLGAGGHVVAETLGGRLLHQNASDPDERQALNVVEEMAIASGTPVPPVYLLENEQGINAFAAGYSPDDAVIGVTRGSIEKLSRDELQGVIAHEFSHILNGDMRLNIRLIGLIHGILVIGLIGYYVLRSGAYAAAGRSRSSRDGGGGRAALLIFGLALLVIGYVGTFFGNIIKAAVSRQREYLADASAVQFTRQPGGIAGALKKIGGSVFGSRVEDAKASEVSHMLFGQGFRSGFFSGLFATHPPLPDRIRRIDPTFDGEFPPVEEPERKKRKRPKKPERRAAHPPVPAFAGAVEGAVAASAIAAIGRPSSAHIDHARRLMEEIPPRVRDAAHEPYGARAVLYALLLDDDKEVRRRQRQRLAEHADPAVYKETLDLEEDVRRIRRQSRLPLIDAALSSLREMSPRQYAGFKENLLALIHADDEVEIFEWVLRRIILRHLESSFAKPRKKVAQYYALRQLGSECSCLLSALAHAGHADDPDTARRALEGGAAHLGIDGVALQPRDRCGPGDLDRSLDTLDLVAPRLKRRLLEACAVSIAQDREVTPDEGELFRAVADSLGCPVPPLLPGQRLG